MVEETKSETSKAKYLIIFWMIFNIILMVMMLPEDFMDLNNWIEIGLWVTSIVGILSMKKWGTAFAIFTLSYTLSTSVGTLIYYQIWLNLIRVMLNTPMIVYLFRSLLGMNQRSPEFTA